jgi:hypothetical protein
VLLPSGFENHLLYCLPFVIPGSDTRY